MGQEILRKGSIYAEGLFILIRGPDYMIITTLSASATFKGGHLEPLQKTEHIKRGLSTLVEVGMQLWQLRTNFCKKILTPDVPEILQLK